MRSLIVAIATIRAPLFVTLLSMIIIALPSQSLELISELYQIKSPADLGPMLRAILFVCAFSAVLVASSLVLLRNPNQVRKAELNRFGPLADSIALSLPIAPIASIAIASLSPLVDGAPPLMQGPVIGLMTWSLLIQISGVLLFAFSVLMFVGNPSFRDAIIKACLSWCKHVQSISHITGLLTVSTVIAIVIAIIQLYPSWFSAAVGPLGVIFLFFSLLCIATSLLCYVYDRNQIPVITLLVVGAWLWSQIPTNDNHRLKILAKGVPISADATEAFRDWLLSRPDREVYKGRDYPVYVISAEGGGLYAAAHTAQTLAHIQDNCPLFARHTFAISGVSGGSLGAAVFAALVAAFPPVKDANGQDRCNEAALPTGSMQNAVRTYFRTDFLTPLLAAGLFPDLFQRFWPFRIPKFDRARALEDSFAAAWGQALPGHRANPFEGSQRDLWSVIEDRPALLLNTTLVHSGERAVISPFSLGGIYYRIFPDRYVDLLNEDITISLASAVSASARFPIVTPPAAHLHRRSNLSAQLVDGGYYENSGVSTAMDLIERMRLASGASSEVVKTKSVETQECAGSNRIKVTSEKGEVITACIKIITIRARLVLPVDSSRGDFLTAVPALYRARIARGVMSINLLYRFYCGGVHCGLGTAARNPHVYVKTIDATALKLPLGWYLSDRSLDLILTEKRSPVRCEATLDIPPDGYIQPTQERREEENACLYSRIRSDLL